LQPLDRILASKSLVGIQIPLIEQQNSLLKLEQAATDLNLPISYWNALSAGFHYLGTVSRECLTAANLGSEILKALQPSAWGAGIYVYLDLFTAIESLSPTEQVQAYQSITALFFTLQQSATTKVVFLETGEIPSRFIQLIHNYDFPLPTVAEITQSLLDANLSTDLKFLNILSGLTPEEIRMALQQVSPGVDLDTAAAQLLGYKYDLFKTYGLEFIGETTTKDIGGLDIIKQSLGGVQKSFSPQARAYQLPLPRGWLIVGVPGTGKTYFAKICSQKLGFPLVNIGIDVVKSGGITKFKQLLKRIDACAPCIPYFDEFDKFFIGEKSGEFLGVILTWLNEKTSKTFVLATLNRLENLPPELTRAGRFDRVFYVDFPTAAERKEILQLHCARFDERYQTGDGPLTPRAWVSILERTEKCTGAELAQMAIEAATNLFYELPEGDQIQINLPDLLAARTRVRTLYSRNPEGVMAIENRAKAFTEPASSHQPHPFDLPKEDLYSLIHS
jgi:ATPase family associated with various cellular activities (AAA)